MELVVKELAAGKAPAAVVGPPLPAASPAAVPPPAGSETQAPGEVQTPVPADAQPPAVESLNRARTGSGEERCRQILTS